MSNLSRIAKFQYFGVLLLVNLWRCSHPYDVISFENHEKWLEYFYICFLQETFYNHLNLNTLFLSIYIQYIKNLSWVFPLIITHFWSDQNANQKCLMTQDASSNIIENPIKANIFLCAFFMIVISGTIFCRMARSDQKAKFPLAFLSLIPILGGQYLFIPFLQNSDESMRITILLERV